MGSQLKVADLSGPESRGAADDGAVILADDDVEAMQHRYYLTRDRTLRNELVRRHSDLAYFLARRFARHGESLDDLVQVASVGLIHAVDRYNPAIGHGFAPFAVPTILGELRRHFRERAWSMRVSRRLQETYLESRAAIETMTQDLGRSPTYAEVADVIGVSEESLLEALEAGRNLFALSLDAPTPGNGRQVDLPDLTDGSIMAFEDRSFLSALADGLSARERLVLELRFGRGMTQSEIGRAIGVSQMQVSRLLTKSLEYMRARAERSA